MDINSLMKEIQESMNSFKENELAYLSLTGKNELQVRDRISYHLYKKYPDCTIARELKIRGINSRIDLAILKNNMIQDIVELKSMYTFDARKMGYFIKAINKDFNKNSELSCSGVNQYEIVIATHIKGVPNKECDRYVKYYGLIKKHLSNTSDYSIFIDEMDSILRNEFLEETYEIKSFDINAGKAFDVEVDICFWIIRKK